MFKGVGEGHKYALHVTMLLRKFRDGKLFCLINVSDIVMLTFRYYHRSASFSAAIRGILVFIIYTRTM